MKNLIIFHFYNNLKLIKQKWKKYIKDIEYGIVVSGSCLMSKMLRCLQKYIKQKITIERLWDNLNKFDKVEIIYINYIESIDDIYEEESVALFDDSDISKMCGEKFEYLADVIDTSSLDKRITKEYHVCESVILAEKKK